MPRWVGVKSLREPITNDERGDRRDDRQQQLDGLPLPRGHERLDEHADDGRAEQDQHRRSAV